MERLTVRKIFCPLGIHLSAQASFCPLVFIRFARPRVSARDRRSCQSSRHIPCMKCANYPRPSTLGSYQFWRSKRMPKPLLGQVHHFAPIASHHRFKSCAIDIHG